MVFEEQKKTDFVTVLAKPFEPFAPLAWLLIIGAVIVVLPPLCSDRGCCPPGAVIVADASEDNFSLEWDSFAGATFFMAMTVALALIIHAIGVLTSASVAGEKDAMPDIDVTGNAKERGSSQGEIGFVETKAAKENGKAAGGGAGDSANVSKKLDTILEKLAELSGKQMEAEPNLAADGALSPVAPSYQPSEADAPAASCFGMMSGSKKAPPEASTE